MRRHRSRRHGNSSSQFAEDLLELVETFFACNPAGRLQSAAGKSFAAVRRVAQCDGVGGGVKTDFVRTRNCAGAIRAETHWLRVARVTYFFGKFFQRSARRILFCRMMDFPAPGFVFGMFREKCSSLCDDSQKKIYADRKIRGPDEARLRLHNRFARNSNLLEPPCCADD